MISRNNLWLYLYCIFGRALTTGLFIKLLNCKVTAARFNDNVNFSAVVYHRLLQESKFYSLKKCFFKILFYSPIGIKKIFTDLILCLKHMAPDITSVIVYSFYFYYYSNAKLQIKIFFY